MSDQRIEFNQGIFKEERIGTAAISGELLCPIESRKNACMDEALANVCKWAHSYGAIKDSSDEPGKPDKNEARKLGHYALISALFFPSCSLKSLETAVKFMANTFWYDDMIDDKEALISDKNQIALIQDNFLQTLNEKMPIGERTCPAQILVLYRTWLDMAKDLRILSKDNMSEFIRGVFETFQSFILVREAKPQSKLSSEDDYISLRRYSSGVYPTLEMGRIINKIDLSPEDKEDIVFKTVYQYATDHIWIVNDAFSFPKEIDGHFGNLVLIKKRDNGQDGKLQDAFDEVIRFANTKMQAFLDWSEFLPRRESILNYVKMLETCMRGNIDWTLKTARYATAQST